MAVVIPGIEAVITVEDQHVTLSNELQSALGAQAMAPKGDWAIVEEDAEYSSGTEPADPVIMRFGYNRDGLLDMADTLSRFAPEGSGNFVVRRAHFVKSRTELVTKTNYRLGEEYRG
ncbi:MAG TPA: hypothetical protein VLG27_00490 [Candidatus Saccharimonadia bacterium]|nr:hypothetical protein [Candidatus Saccharimonadia bacterium]